MTRTANFWNRVARRYAAKPVADQAAYERKLDLTREHLPPEATVLELGCGTGSTAIALAPHTRSYHATDFSPRMLEIARSKANSACADNIRFTCCAAGEVSAPDASQDAILAHSLWHLLEDWRGAIISSHRMLKPGGVLVSSTLCLQDDVAWLRLVAALGCRSGVLPRLSFFTSDDLEHALLDAGFTIVHDWQPGTRRGVFHIVRKVS